MTRRDGRLIALTGDGTRIWGPADTAFSAGIPPRPAPTAPADPAGSAGRTATAAARPVASWGGGASTPGGSGEPEVLDGSNQWESPDERESPDEQGDGFAGVHPHRHGSRPAPGDAPVRHRSRRWHPSGRCPRDPRTAPTPPGAFTTPSPATTPSPGMTAAPPASRTIGDLLFPHGEPSLPEALHVNGERMDLGYVVGVLMGNRDLVRRLAAETGAAPVAA